MSAGSGEKGIVRVETIQVAAALPDPAIERQEHEHAERLRAGFQAFLGDGPGSGMRARFGWERRGPASQEDRRAAEWAVKMAAVQSWRNADLAGLTWKARGEALGVPDRTLRHWDLQSRTRLFPFVIRGRRTIRSPLELREDALLLLALLGPHIGVPSLHPLVQHMGHRELQDLVRRWKRLDRFAERRGLMRLIWKVPGTVWALDHTEPPEPIDGVYPYILSVRDLASGFTLAWLPVRDMTAATTNAVLAELFLMHGAPLVLKADGGPWGKAAETDVFLGDWGVMKFLSPPRYPGYNGAIEAGIRWGKTWTGEQAAQHGRPEAWTSDDCKAARREANTRRRPRRLGGLTPQEAWDGRTPPTPGDRLFFLQTYASSWEELQAHHLEENQGGLGARALAAVERKAIIRALGACGLLEYRRRHVSLLIRRLFLATES
ncbi:MAG: transposase family protein [Polyangiaceae bacterium]|nr:transposase family protein [Polyangiaceae bacterium]